MGTRPRQKPERLPAKLLAIRKHLQLSQPQIARRLDPDLTNARISEYEHGIKEPTLMVLLRYSQLAGVHMETLVNDRIGLNRFRGLLNSD